MTQAQATALAAPIVELFNEMEDVLLKKIAKQLGRDGDLSDASKWRMRQLARAGLLDKEAVKTIRSYTGIQSDMLDIIIETAALHEIDHLDSAVRAADAAALSGVSIPPAEDTAYNAMKAFRRQAQQDINAVNTVMRYKTKQAFVTAVNEAFWDAQKSQRVYNALGMGTAEVITGAESLQTGIRDAISKLSEKGIPAFIDKAGREWSPEAYVRMDIRSTVGNTARQAQWDRCLEHGINLIEVDAHSGARPLCAPYQGRIYSIDGTSGKVRDGSGNEYSYEPLTSTSYGQAAGLFGINCGHHNYPFKAGINFKRYYPLETEEALAENSEQYAKFQKQRYYERQIRKAKKDCMMQDAAKDEEGFVKASQKLARRKEAYSDYCKSAGLRKDNKRTQVYGFDKSISSKATWANRKAKIHNVKGNDLVFNKISGQKEIEKSLKAEFNSEYSNFAKTFGELTTIKGIEAQTYTGHGVFGTYNDNSGVLTLYGVGGKDGRSFMQKTASQHYKDGDWSTKNYMHSFRHELGHAWQKQLSETDPNYPAKLKKIQNMKDDFWSGLTSSPEHATMNLKKEQGKVLSTYGLDKDYDIDELISESVAEYLNGKPRSFAKNVIDILLEKE